MFSGESRREPYGLRAELLAGQVRVGDYHYFTVHDPKERTICAAHFRERVLHHALMNVCEPVLERAAVFDSYACRQGKGQLAAVRRAESYARRYGWFLKLDVRKYFDSVEHTVLRGLLRRKFKDAVVLALFDQVLASYQTAPGRHPVPGMRCSEANSGATRPGVSSGVESSRKLRGFDRTRRVEASHTARILRTFLQDVLDLTCQ